jgi:hypothetical protein
VIAVCSICRHSVRVLRDSQREINVFDDHTRVVGDKKIQCLGRHARVGPAYAAVDRTVKRGGAWIADCTSHTFAKLIAAALNTYKPNRKGY